MLIALGAGLGLVGLAALLVRVSDFHNFYAACFGLGLVAVGLACAALYSLVLPAARVVRHPGDGPHAEEGLTPPVVGLDDAGRRHAGWGSVYLALAALPCLLTAALHYWA
jgi:hypothetical protein